ncbi:MAG: UbiA family prenyltransferase [Candidatus Pacebacteria bacterium]|nr:UbiA family prenyltransferase [Candidatus Paceibacterota bacterium]
MFIKNQLNKFTEKIEKLIDREVNWTSAALLMFSVSFIRLFLEAYSSPGYQGYFFSGYSTFLHAPLLFIAIFLSLMILTICFVKLEFNKSVNLVVLFSSIIMTPPITDLIVTGGKGMGIAYVFFSNFKEGLYDFLAFFGKIVDPGINYGIRLEVFIILAGFGYLVYLKSKNIKKVILGILICYAIFFFYLTFPSIFAILFGSSESFAAYQEMGMRFPVWGVLHDMFSSSLLNGVHTMKDLPQDPFLLMDQQLDIFGTRIGWLLLVFQSAWLFYLGNKQAFNAWRKNLRWERTIYYIFISIIGIALGFQFLPAGNLFNFVDILGFMVFFISIALSFWLAVGINDIYDTKTDGISSPDRPLIAGTLTVKQQNMINAFLFLFIVTGFALTNYLVLILFLMFQAVYFIYSVPPLRFKRVFGLSSLLVGANALLAMMAGFYLVAPIQKISFFPPHILAMVLIGFTMAVNIRDIKDYEGDKAENIKTIPVVFGLEKGKVIIGFMSALALVLVALLTKYKGIANPSLIFSPIIFFLINRKNYNELFIFGAFFLYAIVCVAMLIIY